MSMTQSRERSLHAPDGTQLFVADWLIDAPAATGEGIVLMHGLGEHCGRYAHVAQFFNDCGYSVRAYDHRGHGRSGGARGDVPDAETLIQDAKRVIDDFARNLAAPPLLLGHSMGGTFAAYYATRALSPLGGLILSSPALRIKLSGAQKLLLQVLGVIAPGFGIPNGLESRYLSHRQEVVDAYDNDPLVHPKISARLLRAMLKAIEFAQAHASALNIQTLLVVAGDDHLVDAGGSEAFFRQLAPGVGAIHTYPGYYHEVFNEVEAGRVFDDIRAWLGELRASGRGGIQP
ncbi:MAG: lysophospholipase [Betaproteobacteria bacterium RIFCSPLOWO2_12_FULL_64_23]|nr:MAG: lysophospholipase [Betaproteobacteria bacterium RIFCSPLOWO2_12_FULL_64_23]